MSFSPKERHEMLGRLFEECRQIPTEERDEWYARVDVPDDVVDELRALLRVDDGDLPILDDLNVTAKPPEISGFDAGRIIGRGGMGVVWLFRQQQPSREVAVKMLGSTLSDGSLSRFRREINVLGRLEHDAIARVYEAGVSDSQPYIVMEYVNGVPINEFVGDRPDIESLLELFVQVCKGVVHAHGRGVIHRDLKPANIMVTTEGQVKILDFGIARVLDEGDEDDAQQTRTGMILGTLPYMSPEQARGDSAGIGVQTDIYSLGVLLFELIEGKRPIAVEGMTITQAVNEICNVDAPQLSRFEHRFAGDVRIIAAKALRKEPEQRYDTVAAFADDIQRVLKAEPILARPASAGYVLSRFTRRHRAAVFAAISMVVVLFVATIVSLKFAVEVRESNKELIETTKDLKKQKAQAESEAKRADIEAKTANTFVDFIIRTFLEGDPTQLEEPSLRGAIERVADKTEKELLDFPLVRARLHRFLGKMFEALGKPQKSHFHLATSFKLYGASAPNHPDMTPLHLELAHETLRLERAEDAHELIVGYLLKLENSGKNDSLAYGLGAQLEAEILMRLERFEDACSKTELALEIFEKHGAKEEQEFCLHSYAGALMWLGQYEKSLAQLNVLLELRRQKYPPLHPYIAETLHATAIVMSQSGRSDSAIPFLDEALKIQKTTLGDKHSATISTLRAFGQVLEDQGEYEKALEKRKQYVAITEQNDGKKSYPYVGALFVLGHSFVLQERFDEARRVFQEAITTCETLGVTPDNVGLWFSLANLENKTKHLKEAFRLSQAGLMNVRQKLPQGERLYQYVNMAADIAAISMNWGVAVSLYDEVSGYLAQGFKPVGTHRRIMNSLYHGESLLHLKGATFAAEKIDSARSELVIVKASALHQRKAIEVEIALRVKQENAPRVAELRALLATMSKEKN